MLRILGTYKITYNNGVSQVKNLIDHDDFINIYKPIQDEIYDLEKQNKFKETKMSKYLKKVTKDLFGNEWFTDKSPLFYAIESGYIELLPYQGGVKKCNVVQI